MTRLNYCIVWVHLLASTTTKITNHLLGQRDCWNTITWFTRICLKTVLSVRLYTLCPLCLAICCNLSFYVWGHALNVSFVFGGVLYSCRARGHVVKHFRWTCSAWYGDHALPGVVTTLQAVTVHTRLYCDVTNRCGSCVVLIITSLNALLDGTPSSPNNEVGYNWDILESCAQLLPQSCC